jgi:hypothetical protein
METYIVTYQHNYGLGVAIINASSIITAKIIADNNDEIWDGYKIEELDTSIQCKILDY